MAQAEEELAHLKKIKEWAEGLELTERDGFIYPFAYLETDILPHSFKVDLRDCKRDEFFITTVIGETYEHGIKMGKSEIRRKFRWLMEEDD